MKVAEFPQQNTPKSSKEITENGRARYTMRDFEQLRNPLYAFFIIIFLKGKRFLEEISNSAVYHCPVSHTLWGS